MPATMSKYSWLRWVAEPRPAVAYCTSPGFDINGVHLDLNFDLWTVQTINYANTHWLQNTSGLLDGAGRSSSTFQLGAAVVDPSAVGLTMWYAGVVLENGLVVDGSNSVPVTLGR